MDHQQVVLQVACDQFQRWTNVAMHASAMEVFLNPGNVLRRAAVSCLLLSVTFILLSSFAIGQATTGSIYGTVTDPSGAVLAHATVSARNLQTGVIKTVESTDSGDYTFTVLDPGDYEVSITMTGFKSQTQRGVRLDANQSVHVNFALQLGSAEQQVTVEAGTTLVDTRESQIGTTVDEKRIQDLPLNGRNAYDLVQIVPGVTNYQPDVATGSRQGAQLSVNAIPTNNTGFYLDGSYDANLWRFGGNLLPNPDALQEFRILTSNFDAEFGRSPGGVVNVITRSGTNSFHGVAYDYLRNDVLNAKNYFDTSVTPLRQNQFGATFGGPIRRDKAFFFLSYQGLRVHTPVIIGSSSLVTPTPAEAQGDFSAMPSKFWPKQPNGTFYSCNGVQGVICQNLLDPVAQNLLKFVPLADPTTGRPPEQSSNANLNSDQGMARIDWQLTPSHKLSGTYFESRGTSLNPTATGNQILSYAGMQNYEGQYNAVVNDTWLVSSTKVNDLRLFYSLNHYIISNIYGNQHFLPDLGSQAPMGGNYNAVPFFTITGYWAMGTNNGGPNNLPSSSLGAADTFNWSLGRHELKFGGSYIWDKFASTGGAASNGLFTFAGTTTGNALGDFLLGKASSLRQNNGVFFRSHSQDPSLFVQDNWRVARRLALNFGLRWECFPMYTGQNDTATFVPNMQSTRFPTAPLGLVFSGDPGIPDGIFKTPFNTFAPRFGFAYDVFGNGKTSLRGSYGIFDAAIDQVAVSNNLVQQPYSLTINVSKTPNLVNPYAPGVSPFPYNPDPSNAKFTSGATIFGLEPGADNIPYVQEYSLGLQQQLGSSWSAELSYVGNGGRHFNITHDANAAIYAPGASTTTAGLNARRPYEPTPTKYTFGQISQVVFGSNFNYNSMQMTLKHTFSNRFSMLASYVWSKAIAQGPVVNDYDLASSRGLSALDIRHNFVVSYIYALPDLHALGDFGTQVLSGWQLNGVTTLHTGSPFNITSGVDSSLDGNTNDRPDTIGDPYAIDNGSRAAKIAHYFNTAAFAKVPAGVPFGNTQYNALIGPDYVNTDLSAFKTFKLYGERTALQFRAEVFNLFNNVNLDNPNGVMSSPKFGTIGGASAPRIMQFGLRLSY
ncbi:MAG TPA: TonB-dependent receptor [Terriglobales bacterium]|nr:TonB-dependent receptor [Terriglobales bacterium]